MPRIADPSVIRTILERDRPWAVYALGDLSPGFAERCEWFALEDEPPALALLYRRFDPPILFTLGAPDRLACLIQEIETPAVYLHVRPDALAAIQSHYQSLDVRFMQRMSVKREAFQGLALGEASPLGGADIDAINELYATGDQRGDSPGFFDPFMLEQGIFRGVWEGRELVAVAGTHLVAPAYGVCAIGNVYTRFDRRRRGLAALATSAVVSEALRRNIPTIVLNVNQRNAAATRLYERLGFRHYCDFAEGLAKKGEHR